MRSPEFSVLFVKTLIQYGAWNLQESDLNSTQDENIITNSMYKKPWFLSHR